MVSPELVKRKLTFPNSLFLLDKGAWPEL